MLLHPSMAVAGLGCCFYSSIAPRWKCQASVACVLCAPGTRGRRIRIASFSSGVSHQERQELLWKDLFSEPSAWWDNRLDKKSLRYPDFRHKKTKEALWLNSVYKPDWVDSRLATLDAKPKDAEGESGYEVGNFCREEQLDSSLDVLVHMDRKGIVPSVKTYMSLLKACVKERALSQTKRVHAHLVKHGLESTSRLGEFVVITLEKCGGIEDALQVFHRLPRRSVFSWTAMISGCTTSGHGIRALKMYQLMQEEGVQPNAYTFVSLLKACGSEAHLEEGKRIHSDIIKWGCESDVFVGNCLADMYAKCGSLVDAQSVFDGLSHRDVVSWTIMLKAYAQHGQAEKALELFVQMCEDCVSPDAWTLVSAIQACGMLAEKEEAVQMDGQGTKVKSLQLGRVLHADACRKGYHLDDFVGNTLVGMYGKCGCIIDAQSVFDGLLQRDVVSWNIMLIANVEQGHAVKVLQQWEQMLEDCVPNERTFVSALQACGMSAEDEAPILVDGQLTRVKYLGKGKAVHADARWKGYDLDVFVGSSLISMYGKCGSIIDAQYVFEGLSHCDVVAWTVMLAIYVDLGQADKALQMYKEMRQEGVSPDPQTFVRMLQACSILVEKEQDEIVDGRFTKLKSLERVKAIQSNALMKGYDSDVSVASSLITMYGKCGSIVDALDVFNGLSKRDVVAWTAMLTAYVEQGQAEKALQMYKQMWEQGESPNKRTFVSAIQACGLLAEMEEHAVSTVKGSELKYLERGQTIHADARRKGYHADIFVANTLISMYGKCGSIVDAENVFADLPMRNVVSWNAMLSAYIEHGYALNAVQLYDQMYEEGFNVDERTFVSVFQACGMLAEKDREQMVDVVSSRGKWLEKGKAVHAEACRKGCHLDVFVGNTLVGMYSKFGSIVDAQNVFDALSNRNVVSWNVMLAAYIEQGQGEKAIELYEQMLADSLRPDKVSIVSALQACRMIAEKEKDVIVDKEHVSLIKGRAIHLEAQKEGYDKDASVANTLISMYGKCGSIMEAQKVFDGLSQRNVVSWNAILVAYVEQGQVEKALQLYKQLQKDALIPNQRTFVSALQACSMLAEKEADFRVDGQYTKMKALKHGKAIHADACGEGYSSDVFVGNTLISMYSKCRQIVDAQNVFDGLPQRNVVTWTALLTAYVEHGEVEKAFLLFEQMQGDGVSPDNRTFVIVLQACGMLGGKEEAVVVDGRSTRLKYLEKGREVHAAAQRKGYDSDVYVGNSLIGMYGKCGSLVDAEKVFKSLPHHDVVTWTSMLMACLDQGEPEKALQLYRQKQQEGVHPDARTLVSVLQACAMLAEREADVMVDGQFTKPKSLETGREVHDDADRYGFSPDSFVASTLIAMYGKCRSTLDAWNVFNNLSERHLVSWNAMLTVYVEQGPPEKALLLYKQMLQEGQIPDDITLVCIARACGKAGSLTMLRQVHNTLRSSTKYQSPFLSNSLINAYGRCASMVDAEAVFDALSQPDLVSWNTLIVGYARQGDSRASLQCYDKMQLAGVNPDGVTFLSLLSACSHAGLVEKGVEYLESMSRDYGLTPGVEHYASIVDLLGRAGCFSRIQDLLSTMPMQPDLAMWLCLLGVSRKYGKVVLGEQAFDSAIRLQPMHAAPYIVMSNIYAVAGLSDNATKVNALEQDIGAWKKPPGQSWTEHEEEVHTFLVEDRKHPQCEQLYDLLRIASLKLRPKLVVLNATDLVGHPGKLAIY